MAYKLVPVRDREIEIGKQLTWSVYDKFGNLLLREGNLVSSQRQIDGLSANGLYRETVFVSLNKGTDCTAEKPPLNEQYAELISVKLSTGDALQLQDVTAGKQQYYVRLIGYVNKKSVLVTHPTINDKLCFIKEGHGFQLRGFSGTQAFEFNTDVVGVCLSPYPYLHLAFPARVKTTTRRAAVRVKFKSVCSVELLGSGAKVAATIEDMSISGALIHAREAFGEVGDEVAVSLRLPSEDETRIFTVHAVVRNVNRETDSSSGDEILMHGMQFSSAMTMDLTVLQNVIYKRMLEL